LWRGCALRKEGRDALFWHRQSEDFFEWQHKRGAAERLEKSAACGRQKKRYLSL
jgi:hypothetical protein